MSARRLSRVIARTLLVVVALLLAVGVGEIAVRLAGVEPSALMVKDAVVGQKYRPGMHASLYDEEARRHVDVRVNDLGFRDVEHAREPAPGTVRVVMLGDSFEAGLSVDFDRTFPRVVDRVLNDRSAEAFALPQDGARVAGASETSTATERSANASAPTERSANASAPTERSATASAATEHSAKAGAPTEGSAKASAERHWEVISLAVAGYGTAQELLAYEEYGRPFHPRVVVLNFFAGNDVSDNSSELSTSPRPYFRLADGRLVLTRPSESRQRLTAWLNEYSRLYTWQKRQTQKLERLVKRSVILNPVDRVFMAGDDPVMSRAWAITEALIVRLDREVRADGGRLLVSYIPFADEINRDWWAETVAESAPLRAARWDFDGPSRRLAAFCRANGIAFASPRDELLASAGRERAYFKHGHFNEHGHDLYGEFLAAKILELDGGPERPALRTAAERPALRTAAERPALRTAAERPALRTAPERPALRTAGKSEP